MAKKHNQSCFYSYNMIPHFVKLYKNNQLFLIENIILFV